MTSSVVTSQKWNLRFQIGQVHQFCIHRISARYHIVRLHTFEGETFGSFNVLIDHRGITWLVTMETLCPKYFWNQILLLLSVSETYLKRKQSYSPKNSKHFCAYHAPTEWVGRSYWKKPCVIGKILSICNNVACFWTKGSHLFCALLTELLLTKTKICSGVTLPQ